VVIHVGRVESPPRGVVVSRHPPLGNGDNAVEARLEVHDAVMRRRFAVEADLCRILRPRFRV
jgi:hypothetical protein